MPLSHEKEFAIEAARRADELRQTSLTGMQAEEGRRGGYVDPIIQLIMGLLQPGGGPENSPELKRLLGKAEGYGDISSEQYGELINNRLPALISMMRGEAIEKVPGRFDAATSRLKETLGRRGLYGGANPTSGDAARLFSTLEAGKESERAGALRDVAKFGFGAESELRTGAAKNALSIGELLRTLGATGEGARSENLRTLLSGGIGALNANPYDPTKYLAGLIAGTNEFGQNADLRGRLGVAGRQPGPWGQAGIAALQAAIAGAASAGGAALGKP